MDNNFSDRRSHCRYCSEQENHFAYDIKTDMDFQIKDKDDQSHLGSKHHASIKNVSAVGLCFESEDEVHMGDGIHIEVHFDDSEEHVDMEGRVKWIIPHGGRFDAGVELDTVQGKEVSQSIHIDKVYEIEWSDVLETVFGKYKADNK